jgi:hypothetical protein
MLIGSKTMALMVVVTSGRIRQDDEDGQEGLSSCSWRITTNRSNNALDMHFK